MKTVIERLNVDRRLLATYIVVYFAWGLGMNAFGEFVEIAMFTYWWQVITCYILYMIPISLFLRPYAWYDQYAYGLFFMGLLEFGGYALGSSIAFENNILDVLVSQRNFSLAMTLFFASYFPLGNWLVNKVYTGIVRREKKEAAIRIDG